MGTYSIIYLRKPTMANEVNEFLKEKYDLEYENHNGVDYGIFFSQEMFDEDLRFINEDEEGKTQLRHFERPISKETFYWLKFGAGNCFGDNREILQVSIDTSLPSAKVISKLDV